MDFDSDDLDKINDFIGKNDNWGLWNNCSYFASGVWNSVSDTKLNSVGFLGINHPSILAESIKKQKGYETGRDFASASEVGYKSKGKYTVSEVYGVGTSKGITNSSGSSISSGSLSSGSSSGSSTPSSSGSSSGSSNGSSLPKRKN